MAHKHTRRDVLAGAAACAVVPVNFASTNPTKHIVEIKKLKFQPETITVKTGDTIQWINHDIAPHTATANSGSWDSEKLKKNGTFELVVTAETEVNYFCIFHPHMKGTIERV